MSYENLDLDTEPTGEEEALPEESSNRTFLIIAGILGAIALLALLCIAVYALVLVPKTKSAQENQKATVAAQNTEVALIIARTSTAAAQAAIEAAYTHTPTATSVSISPTIAASPTPVVAMGTTTTPQATATLGPELATATALHATLTANAILYAATLTARVGPTAVPETGFADDVGLPTMMGLAVLLIVVIFLVRRLRTAS
jgi:hypothetical protein